MSLSSRTPQEAFRTLQDHFNGTLNKTLTRYRLELFRSPFMQDQASLTFFDRRSTPVAVPLFPSSWYLFLGIELKAVSEGRRYQLQVLRYAYRVQRTPSLQDEAEIRFEYVSRALAPRGQWSRQHVQLHRDYENVRPGFAPNRLHIPTGGVVLEDVIRFVIADLGVPPLTDQWEEELRRSATQTRDWTSYEAE